MYMKPRDRTRPLRPFGARGWAYFGRTPVGEAYVHQESGARVLVSVVDVADAGKQHLVSISMYCAVSRDGRRRASDAEVANILRIFCIPGAEEDNHEPGIARKFWWRIGQEQVECECKADEEIVVEPDGYRWSRKREQVRR